MVVLLGRSVPCDAAVSVGCASRSEQRGSPGGGHHRILSQLMHGIAVR